MIVTALIIAVLVVAIVDHFGSTRYSVLWLAVILLCAALLVWRLA